MSSGQQKSYKLGEVATFYNGRAYKNEEFKSQGTPIVRIQNLTGEGKTVYSDLALDDKKYIDNGDLIYAWSATFGPYIWKGQRSIYHYHIWKVECNPELLDQTFFYYKLKQISDDLKGHGNGTLFVHITKAFMEGFRIELPDLITQKKIASILSSLDDKIELNRQTAATLEAMAQALFKEWFVDFRFPGASGVMVESERVMVPKGWRVGKLRDFGEIVCGKTPSKANKNFFGGEIPFIKIPDMHNSVFIVDTEDSLTDAGGNSQKNKFIPAGSVAVSCIATVGLVALTSMRSQTNQQINSIVPKDVEHLYYLYFSLRNMQGLLRELGGGGSATLNVNTTTFSSINIILPEASVMKKFHGAVAPIFKLILQSQQQTQTLTHLRNGLLPRLMKGAFRSSNDDVSTVTSNNFLS